MGRTKLAARRLLKKQLLEIIEKVERLSSVDERIAWLSTFNRIVGMATLTRIITTMEMMKLRAPLQDAAFPGSTGLGIIGTEEIKRTLKDIG